MIRYAFWISALLFSFNALACVANDPAATAQWIYKNVPDFYVPKKGQPRYLSPNLYKLLGREWKCQEPGEICANETSPWTNTQDGYVLEPIMFTLVSTKSDAAVVNMRYMFGWPDKAKKAKPTNISISLIQNAGCWVLDDIRKGNWSFKNNLANWTHYEAQ